MRGNSQSLNFSTWSKEDFPDCISKQTKRLTLPRSTSHLGSQDQIKEHLRSQLKSSETLHGKTNLSPLTMRARKPSCCKLFPWVPMQSFIVLKEMSQAGEQGKRERKDCLYLLAFFKRSANLATTRKNNLSEVIPWSLKQGKQTSSMKIFRVHVQK